MNSQGHIPTITPATRVILALAVVIGIFLSNNASAVLDWVEATSSAGWLGRYGHASVVHDGKIWILGGAFQRSDIWHSSDGISWTCAVTSVSLPWEGRLFHSAMEFQGKVWVLGGNTYSGVNELKNDVWVSTNGVAWTCVTASAPWAPRQDVSTLVYDGKMWVIGGEGQAGGFNDVWYSTDGQVWTSATLNAEWNPRWGRGACVFNNKMWIAAGLPGSNPPLNDVWNSSDGVHWISVTLNAEWSGRSLSRNMVVFAQKMWILGGSKEQGLTNEVWFSSDGEHWLQATPDALWTPRAGHATVEFNNKIWLLGGEDVYGWPYRKDVWYSVLRSPVTRWQRYPPW